MDNARFQISEKLTAGSICVLGDAEYLQLPNANGMPQDYIDFCTNLADKSKRKIYLPNITKFNTLAEVIANLHTVLHSKEVSYPIDFITFGSANLLLLALVESSTQDLFSNSASVLVNPIPPSPQDYLMRLSLQVAQGRVSKRVDLNKLTEDEMLTLLTDSFKSSNRSYYELLRNHVIPHTVLRQLVSSANFNNPLEIPGLPIYFNGSSTLNLEDVRQTAKLFDIPLLTPRSLAASHTSGDFKDYNGIYIIEGGSRYVLNNKDHRELLVKITCGFLYQKRKK